jgi:pilus assembly protein FimV
MVMSKKILSEATVRQFMKLAELGALSNKFVSETYEEEVVEEGEEDEVVEEMDAAYLREEGDEEEAEEAEEDLADLGDEEEAPEAEEEGGEVDLTPDEAEVLRSILQKLESAMGEEEAPEEEAGLGDEEAELDMGAEEAPEMEMGAEEELPEEEPIMEDAACGTGMKLSRETGKCEPEEHPSLGRKQNESAEALEEMVNRIAARVAKRILAAQKK